LAGSWHIVGDTVANNILSPQQQTSRAKNRFYSLANQEQHIKAVSFGLYLYSHTLSLFGAFCQVIRVSKGNTLEDTVRSLAEARPRVGLTVHIFFIDLFSISAMIDYGAVNVRYGLPY